MNEPILLDPKLTFIQAYRKHEADKLAAENAASSSDEKIEKPEKPEKAPIKKKVKDG